MNLLVNEIPVKTRFIEFGDFKAGIQSFFLEVMVQNNLAVHRLIVNASKNVFEGIQDREEKNSSNQTEIRLLEITSLELIDVLRKNNLSVKEIYKFK